MNGKHYLGKRVSSFELYDEIGPITGVALITDDAHEVFAGNDTGYVLEIECPYATQEMAEAALESVASGSYKGFRATGAGLDINAELGDGITVNGIYSVLAQQSLKFGPGHISEIAAPGENAVDHEYPYISPEKRKAQRARNAMWSAIEKNSQRITLEVGELKTYTDGALGDLAKDFGASLGDLEGDIYAELENYSTLEITAERIDSAVSQSKTYTDSKTGEVVASLKNYSTIEQTNQSITAAVTSVKEYTNSSVALLGDAFDQSLGTLEGNFNAKLEHYSTIDQTASKVSSAVSESKSYTDSKTGEVKASLNNYSTIEQTASQISAAVTESKQYTDGKYQTLSSSITQTATDITALIEGVDGKYSSVKQTVDGLTVETVNGKTIIAGSCIETGSLNLTGAISWGDLDSTVQGAISAQPSLPGYIKSTYIDATSVQSFCIKGNRLEAVIPYSAVGGLSDNGTLLGFVLTGAYGNQELSYLQIYAQEDLAPETVFTSPNYCYARWDFPYTTFSGRVQFEGPVSGVPAVFG